MRKAKRAQVWASGRECARTLAPRATAPSPGTWRSRWSQAAGAGGAQRTAARRAAIYWRRWRAQWGAPLRGRIIVVVVVLLQFCCGERQSLRTLTGATNGGRSESASSLGGLGRARRAPNECEAPCAFAFLQFANQWQTAGRRLLGTLLANRQQVGQRSWAHFCGVRKTKCTNGV